MKYVKQFGIILSLSFAGELLHALLPLPIPASIYGVVLLFILLEKKLLTVADIQETVLFLIQIMPILFVPAAAGLITSWDVIRTALLPYLVITFLVTVTVMAITGRVTQFVIRRDKRINAIRRREARRKTEGDNCDA